MKRDYKWGNYMRNVKFNELSSRFSKTLLKETDILATFPHHKVYMNIK